MIVEIQNEKEELLAVGEMSWSSLPLVGDKVVVKDNARFFKTRKALVSALNAGIPVMREDLWYGRVKVLARAFFYMHGPDGQPELVLTVEDLAAP